MPDYGVIRDISETLERVLTAALAPLDPASPPVAEVHDLQGNISTAPARLTLFLYEVVEDPSARNRPRRREITPPDITVRKPPMALILRYILTPWSASRLTDHLILGRAMQVLYDGAIISGPTLSGRPPAPGTLAGSDQALKVTMTPLTLEERARVWYSVQKAYRLSVAYEVRVVNVDSEVADRITPVADRSLGYSEPETRV